MEKKLLIITLVFVSVFIVGSYFVVNKPIKNDFPEQLKMSDKDHVMGKGRNVLVEYSDLQCPSCKMFHDYFKSEKTKDKKFADLLENKYAFVYRHFPLTNIHKNAEIASKYAEASAMQDKYYEFIDRLFETQGTWSDSDNPEEIFLKIARDLGLDEKKLKQDSTSKPVSEKIQSDISLALSGEVDSTPTFFVNGRKLAGYNSFDEFKSLLESSAQ
jgi:protein-disulfide isomerase